jgi:hypothetical protein
LVGGLVVVAVLIIVAVLLGKEWPFTEPRALAELGQASQSTVKTKNFRETFFPHPGCVLEDVTLRSQGETSHSGAVLTAKKLTIQGSYSGLLSRSVPLIRVEGAHVVLPPLGTGQRMFQGTSGQSKTTVGEIVADGTIIDVTSRVPGKPPLHFEVRKLAIHNPGGGRVMSIEVEGLNPSPPGMVKASFRLGPWQEQTPEQTRVSGTYSYQNAKLGVFNGIAGSLSSRGTFDGSINQLRVRGSTDVPDFEVTRSGHRVHLTADFDVFVDATAGDVTLRSVNAHWGHTTVLASGTIGRTPDHKSRAAELNAAVRNGRIDDVLFLFVQAPKSPLAGEANFETKIEVPSGHRRFLQKVELDGNFVISGARFTNANTQARVDKLSAQARGQKNLENPAPVVTDWEGHVLLKDGTARFTPLRLRVPGAATRLQGTYTLQNQRVDLHGMLYLQVKLSQATSGIKAILVKPLEPFLKKDRRGGAKMPVGVSGTYSRPSFHEDPI